MKKLFLVLVVILSILAISSPAFAGRYDREDANTVGYSDFKIELVDGVAIDAPTYVYGATIVPTVANGFAQIINNAFPDNALLGVTLNGNQEIEVSGTTVGIAVRAVYDPPLNFSQAVGIDITNCTVVLEYRQ